jgi:hypothetical protein
MPKQYADYIRIVPREDVESITDGVVTLKDGKTWDLILATNNLIPDEEPAEVMGNPCFKQTLKLIAEKLSSEMSLRYRFNRPAVVLLYGSDDSVLIWGSISTPVRVSLAPKPNADVLDFIRTSPISLF